MAFGFPARTTSSRTYQLPQDELAAVVKSALEDLGWTYNVLADGEFLASVPFSGWTWGEHFKVRILPGGVIEAESKCITVRMPQVFDFGKNRKNIETFFALVEHIIRQGVYQRPVSATKQESSERGNQAAPTNNRTAALFGGCLIVTLLFFSLTYFISAVVGLLTGYLYLPGRGHGGTIQGTWARIISVIILAIFAWILVWVLRERKKRRQ
jgi:ABC-type multidrug transport system permease subunit